MESKLGQLAGLPGGAVAERLGPDGRRAWGLARGGAAARVRGRRPPAELAESLEFPEAIGNELTLRRALGRSSRRRSRGPSGATASSARSRSRPGSSGGGSWRRSLTLREPSADADRIRIALAPRLAELPAPVLELRLELVELASRPGSSSSSSPPGRRTAPASAKGCARCGRAPGPAPSAPSWRSHRGRGFPRRERCSYRGTTERAAPGARRGELRRTPWQVNHQPVAVSVRSGVCSIAGGRRSR